MAPARVISLMEYKNQFDADPDADISANDSFLRLAIWALQRPTDALTKPSADDVDYAEKQGVIIVDSEDREVRTIHSDMEVPRGVVLRFVPGLSIEVDEGAALTVNGEIEGGVHQLFTGSVKAGKFNRTTVVRPEWWGATGDYVHVRADDAINADNDDSDPIQRAIDFFPYKERGFSGGTVLLRSGTYRCESPIKLYDGISLIGEGHRQGAQLGSRLYYAGNAPGPFLEVKGYIAELDESGPYGIPLASVRLENLALFGDHDFVAEKKEPADIATDDLSEIVAGNAVPESKIGLRLWAASASLRNVTVRNFRDVAIEIWGGQNSTYERVFGTGAGIGLRLVRGNALTFLGCWFQDTNLAALQIEGGHSAWFGGLTAFEGCHGDATVRILGGGHAPIVTFENCYWEGNQGHYIVAGESAHGPVRALSVRNPVFVPAVQSKEEGQEFDVFRLDDVQWAYLEAPIVFAHRRSILSATRRTGALVFHAPATPPVNPSNPNDRREVAQELHGVRRNKLHRIGYDVVTNRPGPQREWSTFGARRLVLTQDEFGLVEWRIQPEPEEEGIDHEALVVFRQGGEARARVRFDSRVGAQSLRLQPTDPNEEFIRLEGGSLLDTVELEEAGYFKIKVGGEARWIRFYRR
jgi:hypothetical protein